MLRVAYHNAALCNFDSHFKHPPCFCTYYPYSPPRAPLSLMLESSLTLAGTCRMPSCAISACADGRLGVGSDLSNVQIEGVCFSGCRQARGTSAQGWYYLCRDAADCRMRARNGCLSRSCLRPAWQPCSRPLMQTVLAKEAWGAALARASGEKVLDDPKLLRKSLKKETKLKAKKSQAWQERLGKQEEQQQARQQK